MVSLAYTCGGGSRGSGCARAVAEWGRPQSEPGRDARRSPGAAPNRGGRPASRAAGWSSASALPAPRTTVAFGSPNVRRWWTGPLTQRSSLTTAGRITTRRYVTRRRFAHPYVPRGSIHGSTHILPIAFIARARSSGGFRRRADLRIAVGILVRGRLPALLIAEASRRLRLNPGGPGTRRCACRWRILLTGSRRICGPVTPASARGLPGLDPGGGGARLWGVLLDKSFAWAVSGRRGRLPSAGGRPTAVAGLAPALVISLDTA